MMTEWTAKVIADEEQRRQKLRDAGRCPDSGLHLHACHRTVCDCFTAGSCAACKWARS